VILLQIFTGGDFSSLLGGVAQAGPRTDSAIQNCETGADANANDDCRLAAGRRSSTGTGRRRCRATGAAADHRRRVDADPCGTASNATGPFYCPPEETVYIDPTFFDVLEQQFGDKAGDLAQLYVLAHEYGHHIQQITGIFDQLPEQRHRPGQQRRAHRTAGRLLRRGLDRGCAQQKDAHGVAYLQRPTDAQIDDALAAAATVGDDHIQAQSSGA
jgi:predicted metalloprotease